jgi:hypothetical protein
MYFYGKKPHLDPTQSNLASQGLLLPHGAAAKTLACEVDLDQLVPCQTFRI